MFFSSYHRLIFAILSWIILAVEAQVSDRPSQAPPSEFPSATSLLPTSSSATSSVNASSSSSSTISASAFPPLNTVSPCVADCLSRAVGATGCSSLTDVFCFCPNRNFTEALVGCISGSCPTERNSTEALARQFCNLVNSSSSLSFPSSVSVTSSLPATVPPITTTPPATSASSTSEGSSTSTPADNSAKSVLGVSRSMGCLSVLSGVLLGSALFV